jgi:carboxymethylenebutenolidase
MLACDLDATMTDADAAVQLLLARGAKVAVIGFCWGGGLALRAAQVLDVACAVPFYGTRLNTYMIAPLKVPVQGHFGRDDDHVPPDLLASAQAYWPEMEVFVYDGAGHAFANEARPADYVAVAAEQAHARAERFIAAHL